MIAGVAETHTALWHLFDDSRLSAAARTFIDEAAGSRRSIAISSYFDVPVLSHDRRILSARVKTVWYLNENVG